VKGCTLCVLVLAAVFTTGCASSGSSGSTASTGSAASAAPSATSGAPRRDPNTITREELADPALSSLDVLEAIRSLRPNFLTSRGTQTISYTEKAVVGDPETGKVHASIDNAGVIALDELKRIHVKGVIEIRFLSAAAAMQRFGGSAKQGPVIVVRTM